MSPTRFIPFTGWWLALWGVYMLLVGNASPAELAFGLVAALISAIAAATVRKYGAVHFSFERNWIRPLARLPWKALTDCALVLATDCRRPFKSHDSGRFIEVEFNPGDDSPVSVTRRALVAAAVSFAPNSFVVLLDPERRRLLVHQLIPVRQSPPDKEWPL